MPKFSPMLAATAPEDLDKLRYPLLASEKIDGIRCWLVDPQWYVANLNPQPKHREYIYRANFTLAVSRSGKPIPNLHIQDLLDQPGLAGLDGELTCGTSFNSSTSAIMAHAGEPDFQFHIFDTWNIDIDFQCRQALLNEERKTTKWPAFCKLLPQHKVSNSSDLDQLLSDFVSSGSEGIITRLPTSYYKFGRSTAKEQGMMKLKPFKDAEALIVGVEPLYVSVADADTNELGYAKRSYRIGDKVQTETLGALRCLYKGVEFKIGTGFSQLDRDFILRHQDIFIGKWAKFRYLAHGMKDKPRHSSFLGIRNKSDLS